MARTERGTQGGVSDAEELSPAPGFPLDGSKGILYSEPVMRRYDYGWSPYVPVAQRRAKARKQMDKLRKQGVDIQPVEIEGRTIARSFWGKGWCDHLDSFGDYANRLPRGRTYVRNGSVCHLAISKGSVEAIVSGSELYTVSMSIQTLPATKWKGVKQRCTGRIGSLLELLQGKLSDEIMDAVTDRKSGMFPGPKEIKYDCNCPDWAGMCKHIAAVIYGIGARLDERPELLFVLRGVDHEELIDADAAVVEIGKGGGRKSKRRALATDSLEGVFGVEFEEGEVNTSAVPKKPRRAAKKAAAKKTTGRKRGKKQVAVKKTARKATKVAKKKTARKAGKPFRPTGPAVAALRRKLGMSKAEFARQVGVSGPTITNWESTKGPIRPREDKLAGLVHLHERSR